MAERALDTPDSIGAFEAMGSIRQSHARLGTGSLGREGRSHAWASDRLMSLSFVVRGKPS
ncbi:hypothetical protein M2427_008082 [Bradyrhizobium sp. BR13661]|jgi:hypothetical protein|nr:hypothetical protein [Bradyrhizobium sp. BR13661]